MRKITKILFALTDAFAWALLTFSLVGVVAFPFVGPIHAKMSQESLTSLGIIGTCAIWLTVAIGAYAITRRRALGLLLVLAPAITSAISGRLLLALAYAVVVLVLLATPFLFALLQSRSAAASTPAA